MTNPTAEGPSALTEAQQDGLECIDCGTETAAVMIPVLGRQSKYDSQLFRCDSCHRAASGATDARLVIDPGTASDEEIGEFILELSKLYRMMGGSGIRVERVAPEHR